MFEDCLFSRLLQGKSMNLFSVPVSAGAAAPKYIWDDFFCTHNFHERSLILLLKTKHASKNIYVIELENWKVAPTVLKS